MNLPPVKLDIQRSEDIIRLFRSIIKKMSIFNHKIIKQYYSKDYCITYLKTEKIKALRIELYFCYKNIVFSVSMNTVEKSGFTLYCGSINIIVAITYENHAIIAQNFIEHLLKMIETIINTPDPILSAQAKEIMAKIK